MHIRRGVVMYKQRNNDRLVVILLFHLFLLVYIRVCCKYRISVIMKNTVCKINVSFRKESFVKFRKKGKINYL